MEGYIKSEIKSCCAVIEFFHPMHNSMTMELLGKLSRTIDEAEESPDVKCILLRSGGDRSFCAGANFDELKSISDPEAGLAFFSGFANVINSIRKSSKLVVGRIQGKSVGGGVGLVSACDIAFGTGFASVRLSELAIGLGPFVIASAVIRKTGLPAFSELTLRPKEWKDANWAKNNGMLSEVFEDATQMDAYIENYIQEISSYSQDAIREIKRLLWHDTDHWPELMTARAAVSGTLALNLTFK